MFPRYGAHVLVNVTASNVAPRVALVVGVQEAVLDLLLNRKETPEEALAQRKVNAPWESECADVFHRLFDV